MIFFFTAYRTVRMLVLTICIFVNSVAQRCAQNYSTIHRSRSAGGRTEVSRRRIIYVVQQNVV